MGKLYLVGIGPGSRRQMTVEALEAIRECECIIGYSTYVKLLEENMKDELLGKNIIATGMRQETDRCQIALQKASEGINTAFICSGDSVVYGMAGLVYELWEAYDNVEIKVISGVSAAFSGGALAGAPLGHDFAVISLSDLLTPWEKIEKRLLCAAAGDMCIAIYNPASRGRSDYLQRAVDILQREMPADRVCAAARNIGRAGEAFEVMTLSELREYKADMFTTVFVGNSETKNIKGYMVTPRGYRYGRQD